MKTIKTIDLWIEQQDNDISFIKKAFSSGFETDIPYDAFKLVQNCNCLMQSKSILGTPNKHTAIIFYNKNTPTRLLLLSDNTNIPRALNSALKQHIGSVQLLNIMRENDIHFTTGNMFEAPIIKSSNNINNAHLTSCNSWQMLHNILTNNTNQNGFQSHKEQFVYDKNIMLDLSLKTPNEQFNISHKGAYINKQNQSLALIQANSPISEFFDIYETGLRTP